MHQWNMHDRIELNSDIGGSGIGQFYTQRLILTRWYGVQVSVSMDTLILSSHPSGWGQGE